MKKKKEETIKNWLQVGSLQGRYICKGSGAISQKTEMKMEYKISAQEIDSERRLVSSHIEH